MSEEVRDLPTRYDLGFAAGYREGFNAGYKTGLSSSQSAPAESVYPQTPDGLSYEEIYGSVVYQQNNKKKE